MPRDSSGNYTLPAGNPVITGTTIDSSWANDLADDLKAEMQDSLSRTGNGGMLTTFRFGDGTISAPGMAWSSETNSGFYRSDTNDFRISVAGADRARFRADASNPFQIWDGSTWGNVVSAGVDTTITGAFTFTGTTVIPEAAVTDHEAALTITESQISDLGSYSVTSHTHTESDITDLQAYLLASSTAAITGVFTLDAPVAVADFGTGGKVKDGLDTAQPIGFNVMPAYEIDIADSFDLAHNGMYWHTDGAATIAFTCADDADIPQGATYVLSNESSGGVQTVVEGAGVTLKWFDGSGTVGTGTRTLGVSGICTIYKYSDTVFHIWGNAGLS